MNMQLQMYEGEALIEWLVWRVILRLVFFFSLINHQSSFYFIFLLFFFNFFCQIFCFMLQENACVGSFSFPNVHLGLGSVGYHKIA